MSHDINRRNLLRLGALGLSAPLLATATPVGTATLDRLTITTSTAAISAKFISNLVVKDVTVGGVPVTA